MTRSNRARMLLKGIVTLTLLAYLLYEMDLELFRQVIVSASPWLILLALAVYGVTVVLSVARWYVILDDFQIHTRFRLLTQITLIGYFFNLFLPSAIGGDVFRAYYLSRRRKTGMSTTLTTILLERSGGMWALLAIGLVATGLHPFSVEGVPVLLIFTVVALVFILCNVALFHPWMHRRVIRLLERLHMQGVEAKVELVSQGLHRVLRNPHTILMGLIYSFGVQLLVIVSMWIGAMAIGLEAPFGAFLVFIPVVNLAIMIPLTINGIGLREGVYYLLFSQIGVPVEQAVTLSLINFLVVLATAVPGGIVYSFYKKEVEFDTTAIPELNGVGG